MSEFEKFNISLDDGKDITDSKILDFISGNTLQNRQRKLTSIVAEMVVGTTLITDDLIRKVPIKGQPQGSVFVASKIMKLLILRALKTYLGTRREENSLQNISTPVFFPMSVLLQMIKFFLNMRWLKKHPLK